MCVYWMCEWKTLDCLQCFFFRSMIIIHKRKIHQYGKKKRNHYSKIYSLWTFSYINIYMYTKNRNAFYSFIYYHHYKTQLYYVSNMNVYWKIEVHFIPCTGLLYYDNFILLQVRHVYVYYVLTVFEKLVSIFDFCMFDEQRYRYYTVAISDEKSRWCLNRRIIDIVGYFIFIFLIYFKKYI